MCVLIWGHLKPFQNDLHEVWIFVWKSKMAAMISFIQRLSDISSSFDHRAREKGKRQYFIGVVFWWRPLITGSVACICHIHVEWL